MKEYWELKHGNILVGRLILREIDQPWFVCNFEPTDAFEQFKPLFMEEVRLLHTNQMDRWVEFYEHTIDNLGLQLESPDGGIIKDWLLHIENGEAWFRY